jgi:two-component system sensor histidine kinase and response regulator WspE
VSSELGDLSMLDLFRAEVETHAPVLSEGLLALEKDPGQGKRLEALMRAAHSIKGAARIVGVDAAVQVAHAMEDTFVAAQAGRVKLTSAAIDVLLRGVDTLSQIAQNAETGLADWTAANEASLRRLAGDLAAVRDGRPPEVVQAPAPLAIRPADNLDRAAAEELRGRLLAMLARGQTHFRFDLSGVRDVEPAGLALLAAFAGLAGGRPAPVVLEVTAASPEVRTLFRLTRLDRSYPLPEPAAAGGD